MAAFAVTLAALGALAVFGGLGAIRGPVSASAHEYQYGPDPVAARVTTIQPICAAFRAGTAAELADVEYTVRSDGRIGSLNPWAIRYWTQIHAPAASFTVDVVQTASHAGFPLFSTGAADVRLHDSTCHDVAPASITAGGGQARVNVTGSATGAVYYLSVRYGTQPFLGKPAPSPATVHYDFRTKVDGAVVAGDANGLDLVKS